MIPSSAGYCGHSAHVEMSLWVDGAELLIAQMGHDFLILEAPVDFPPGPARISLTVDANHSEWGVFLPDGITAGKKRVQLDTLTETPPGTPNPVE